MNAKIPESLVSVYSTNVEFDAEMMRAMLADEEIPSTVENANGPFPGITAIPCEVLVAAEHAVRARELVEEQELRHREHLIHDSETDDSSE